VSGYNEKSKRRVVPRWRSSLVSAGTKEFRPLRHRVLPAPEGGDVIESLLHQFQVHPDLGVAAEVIACAARSGELDRGRGAASFIVTQGEQSPSMLTEAAYALLQGGVPKLVDQELATHGKSIARLRQLLRASPQSPTIWADLAWHQAALGDTEKAQRSMSTALALAPQHRWILRAASRLFLHCGELERAHKILLKSPRTKYDPWLMAAELASAQIAGRVPKFIKPAQHLLSGRAFAPQHLSELAAAVATIELESGSGKFAKRLIRQALQDPTENALAQVEWIDRESKSGLELGETLRRVPDAFEASTWVKYKDGKIDEALSAAIAWANYEPFADRPPAMICYLASFLDNYELIIDVATEVLRRHPASQIHRNTLIFAELSTGYLLQPENRKLLNDAMSFLTRCIEGDDPVQAVANSGLLLYRSGGGEDGRVLYERAMELAEREGNFIAKAIAACYGAREAILAGSPWASASLDAANRAAKRINSPGVAFYLRKLNALVKEPAKVDQILSPIGAKKFQTSIPEPRIQLPDIRKALEGTPLLILPPSSFRAG
jgi:tetratricopeptide (TPR) repeat protein